jgi:hypothetical protein
MDTGPRLCADAMRIQIFLVSASDPSPTKDGVVVGTASSINTANGPGFGYNLTLTIPKGVQPAHDSQLYVLEWFATNYGDPVFQTSTAAVGVKF